MLHELLGDNADGLDLRVKLEPFIDVIFDPSILARLLMI